MMQQSPFKLNSDHIDAIRTFGKEGVSGNQLCPICLGGQGGEKSFSVSVTDKGILYNCFRASCRAQGMVFHDLAIYLDLDKFREKKQKPKLNPFPKDIMLTAPPPKRIREYLQSKHELTSLDVYKARFLFAPEKQWLVFPLEDLHKNPFALQSKRLEDSEPGPKYITWRHRAVPVIHFPKTFRAETTHVVLVEDVLSATKCCNLYPHTAALCGAALGEGQVNILHKAGIKHLTFLLDADTWSAKHTPIDQAKKKFGHLFKTIEGRFISKDPKDTTYEELEGLLQFDIS